MRKHRVIKEATVTGPASFAYDIESGQFDNIMASWSASTDNLPGVNPTNLIFCPTAHRPMPLGSGSNYPVMPAVPVGGTTVYASVGQNMSNAFPCAAMITVGVIVPANCVCSIRVEGDEHEEVLTDPNPREKNRS